MNKGASGFAKISAVTGLFLSVVFVSYQLMYSWRDEIEEMTIEDGRGNLLVSRPTQQDGVACLSPVTDIPEARMSVAAKCTQ